MLDTGPQKGRPASLRPPTGSPATQSGAPKEGPTARALGVSSSLYQLTHDGQLSPWGRMQGSHGGRAKPSGPQASRCVCGGILKIITSVRRAAGTDSKALLWPGHRDIPMA
jgi:hypothetical protein